MGDVYDAVHTSLDKRVAIKTLRRRFLEDEIVVTRFLREGQLASRMRHPNIVDVTDCGVIDGLPCLVMEHLEGETLGQVIKREGALPVAALVDVLLPIIAAVDFAHDHGLLHRDLKPSNIFLSRSWNGETVPKVLDFGISKLVSESADAALTTDSAFVGTPHYASPESVRAEKALDRRTDQYSMGVILYEGATGQRPYVDKGGSFLTMAMAICKGDYPTPRALKPELPEAFERVILRAMALRADDRFLSMRLLGEALLPFASERARVIWTPAFKNTENTEAVVVPHTQVLARPSPSAAVAAITGGAIGSATAVSPQWGSGNVRTGSMPVTPVPGGGGPFPSGTPASLSGMGGMHPGASLPPGVPDGTPSFGQGIHSSVYVPPPQKQSAGALVLGAIGLLLAVVIAVGVVVTRTSARNASAAAQPAETSTATSAGGTFTLNVQTNPENAVLELDGTAVGSGHLVRQMNRDGQRHVLRVSAPGYETLLLQFDETQPPPAQIALRAGGQAGPIASTPTKPPTVTGPAGGAAPGKPGRTPGKGPDRPRTDNIDPWE
jgi:serine/threonine-protein kinase